MTTGAYRSDLLFILCFLAMISFWVTHNEFPVICHSFLIISVRQCNPVWCHCTSRDWIFERGVCEKTSGLELAIGQALRPGQ